MTIDDGQGYVPPVSGSPENPAMRMVPVPLSTGPDSGEEHTQPPGRRRILDAARELFPRRGYAGTTLRAIAAKAEVDVALISHHFGGKKGLYEEATALMINPQEVADQLSGVPLDQLGTTIVRVLAANWERTEGYAMVARFKTLLIEDPDGLRTAVYQLIWDGVDERLRAEGIDQVDLRVAIAAGHLMGLGIARTVLGYPGISRMSVGEITAIYGPVVQQALTGPLTTDR
ncbi:TetR/AcrR family transcriptional regulator [Corynebacterium mendelii]|uniref:TetR/AcrR family transcriptional regulator n=1 Tax=Corynebacterium mendelii TaxID=2765362 RepID=A0A939E1R2_9CORY|nr:TetR/AcrR family transcriptional regulator [Corynebacterium mendelii]MBN9645103.1 TetR/AcrR family transcriptional regulator [Corynebacterium mendelii]